MGTREIAREKKYPHHGEKTALKPSSTHSYRAAASAPASGLSYPHHGKVAAVIADETEDLVAGVSPPFHTPPQTHIMPTAVAFPDSTRVDIGRIPPSLLPPKIERLTSSGSAYSSGTEDRDISAHEAEWFNSYTKHTNEKDVIAEGIIEIVQACKPSDRAIKILDIGCGNGDLSLKYLKPIIDGGVRVDYFGVEKEASYKTRFETDEFRTMRGLTINMSDVNCFDRSLLEELTRFDFHPDIVLCSHVGYFGNVSGLTENVINLPGKPMVIFIHQSPHSMVNKLRENLGAKVHTTTNQEILAAIHSSSRLTASQKIIISGDVPSIVTIPPAHVDSVSDPEWHRKPWHSPGNSQETAELCSFMPQRTPRGIVKHRLLEKFTSGLSGMMNDGEITIWNRFILFCKSPEMLKKADEATQPYFAKPSLYPESTIRFALREANIGVIKDNIRTKRLPDYSENPLKVILQYGRKHKKKHSRIPPRYIEAFARVAEISDWQFALEAIIYAFKYALHEFEPKPHLYSKFIENKSYTLNKRIQVFDFSSLTDYFKKTLARSFKYCLFLFTEKTAFALSARQYAMKESRRGNSRPINLFLTYCPKMVTPIVVREIPPISYKPSSTSIQSVAMPSTSGRRNFAREESARSHKRRRLHSPIPSHGSGARDF